MSLLSTANCAGRLVGGWLSDIALSKYNMPRPMALAAGNVVMMAAMLILASSGGAWPLYTAAVVGGASYGAMFALNPAIASEAFGLSSFSILYPTMCLGIAMGSYVLATKAISTADCLLLTLTTHYSLLTTHYCSTTHYCPITFTSYYSMRTPHSSRFTTHYSLLLTTTHYYTPLTTHKLY